jgi:hypothetical protein
MAHWGFLAKRAVAPFDIGTGALEHLRERGCVRLELILPHSTT